MHGWSDKKKTDEQAPPSYGPAAENQRREQLTREQKQREKDAAKFWKAKPIVIKPDWSKVDFEKMERDEQRRERRTLNPPAKFLHYGVIEAITEVGPARTHTESRPRRRGGILPSPFSRYHAPSPQYQTTLSVAKPAKESGDLTQEMVEYRGNILPDSIFSLVKVFEKRGRVQLFDVDNNRWYR